MKDGKDNRDDDAAPENRPFVILRRSEHRISRKDIDPNALKVLYRLRASGHKAYLVGGGVRDLLLGRRPKDFDISTDAHPNEIKKLFRNCFLIGRRFRLAHVRFGDKVIETSTFRCDPEQGQEELVPDENLYRHRDNTFGTPEEDARRRDFTVNGLFYDIEDFSVIDHVGGLEDLRQGIIRVIGDPERRYREDPVRMLRAVRFASRLGFRIEPLTYDAILRHCREIEKASPARMLEEIQRLFAYRSGEAAFRLLRDTRLMQVLFPELDEYFDRHAGETDLFWRSLAALDAGEEPVGDGTPAVMFGLLHYLPFLSRVREAMGQRRSVDFLDLARQTLLPTAQRYHMPRQLFHDVTRMLAFQKHLLQWGGRRSDPRRHFVFQEWLPGALSLFTIHLTATGGDRRELEPWLALLAEAPRPSGSEKGVRSRTLHGARVGEPQASGSRRGSRRRRGRRRPAHGPDGGHTSATGGRASQSSTRSLAVEHDGSPWAGADSIAASPDRT